MALIHAQTEDSYEHLCLGEYLCSSVFSDEGCSRQSSL